MVTLNERQFLIVIFDQWLIMIKLNQELLLIYNFDQRL